MDYLENTLWYLDAFIDENKDRHCEFKDYSLISEKYEKYQNILENYRSTFEELGLDIFAEYLEFYQNLRYISFDEFYNRLVESAEYLVDYVEGLREEYGSVAVVLRLVQPMGKSNLWVTRLIYHLIRPILTGVHCNGDRQNWWEIYNNLSKQTNRLVLIYPDDCMYSGSQFLETMINERSTGVYSFFSEDRSRELEFYVLCPYITSMVKDPRDKGFDKYEEYAYFAPYINYGSYEWIEGLPRKLRDFPSELRHILSESQIFHFVQEGLDPALLGSIYSFIKMAKKIYQDFPPPIVSLFIDFIKFRLVARNAMNIYFQHKLADRISTATYLFVNGAVPGGEIGTLVNNCYYDSTTSLGYDDFEIEKKRCPPSCYKNIKYTWVDRTIVDTKKYLFSILRQ